MKTLLFLIFILLFTALFTFQTFDMPPLRSNPKTCCGRAICMCTHAPGAYCPFRHHMEEQVKAEKSLPHGQSGFAKAPCSTDSPKTAASGYSQDFDVVPNHLSLQNFRTEPFRLPVFHFFVLLRSAGIDRPPRLF
jgi:hypothetical protein